MERVTTSCLARAFVRLNPLPTPHRRYTTAPRSGQSRLRGVGLLHVLDQPFGFGRLPGVAGGACAGLLGCCGGVEGFDVVGVGAGLLGC